MTPAVPSAQTISALLQRRPGVRIELRVGSSMAGVSASWLLPLLSECDWRTAVPRWTNFRLLHPLRNQYRDHPLLFSDDQLAGEVRDEHDDDSER
jgi:hypothetical protein